MNTLSIKQLELYNLIPFFNVENIDKFVAFAKENNIIHKKNNRKSLAGIWNNVDFKGIDLDNEIRNIRRNNSIISSDKLFKNVKEIEVIWD